VAHFLSDDSVHVYSTTTFPSRVFLTIVHAARRNNSSRCLLQRLPRPQDAGTSSNSTRHNCHLGAYSSKYETVPTLLDFRDQMGISMYSVATRRSQHVPIRWGTWQWDRRVWNYPRHMVAAAHVCENAPMRKCNRVRNGDEYSTVVGGGRQFGFSKI
jgi:hypothetical protein